MSVLSNAVISAATATVNCLEGTPCDTGLPVVNASSGLLQTVLQLVFGVLAVLAVIVITIAGIRFIVESTNPQETARARSTIIYALIGLTIALSGEFIVSFVLDQL
ncbi:hypothetical protein H7Y63_00930 [Polaromonas sp.]|nr:hypothetical protein [Candidatus Saccharibacteria bacterium]